MRIDAQTKIEKAACDDRSRPDLCVVELHNGYLYATNGRIAARVPAEALPEEAAILTLHSIQYARDLDSRGAAFGINACYAVCNDGTRFPYAGTPSVVDKIESVLAKPSPDHPFVVSLNARLLLRLADAIGAEGEVALHFRDPLSPIVVTSLKNHGSLGALMPMRNDDTEKAVPLWEKARAAMNQPEEKPA